MKTSMWYKEERMKKNIENSNNFDMSSLLMMVDMVEKERAVNNNYNYKLHVFLLLLRTIKLT